MDDDNHTQSGQSRESISKIMKHNSARYRFRNFASRRSSNGQRHINTTLWDNLRINLH